MTSVPRRKWRTVFRCLLALAGTFVLALIVWGVLWYRWAHKPAPLVVSKETTFITGPVRPDGSINYIAALNERYSEGVTPENNGAVLFWQAMGSSNIPAEDRQEFFKLLGIQPLAEEGDYFVPLAKFVEERGESLKETKEVEVQSKPLPENWIDRWMVAMSRPWSREEFPLLAQWLEANEGPLALVTDASLREHWFHPLVPEDGMLIGALLPASSASREMARTLVARAMLRAHSGQLEEAWQDIMACHRLARLVGGGPTLIDGLVGFVIDSMACEADQSLLQHAALSLAPLEKMRGDLDQLPPFPAMVEKLDAAERFSLLDCALNVARSDRGPLNEILNGLGNGNGANGQTAIDPDLIVTADWNIVLRIGNAWFDRLVAAFRLPDHAQQRAALEQLDWDLEQLGKGAGGFAGTIRSMLSDPQGAASQRVGDIFVTMLMPATLAAHAAEMKCEIRFVLAKLGFALAEYRVKHETYPETLADLVPKYVTKIPKDCFADGELHFERREDGYVLYSVGINGKDDGGSADSAKDQDDLAIRVPAEKKPETP